jgi:hypothetical protein
MQLLTICSDDKLCVYDFGISLSFRCVQTFERHLKFFVNTEHVASRNDSLEQERMPDLEEV